MQGPDAEREPGRDERADAAERLPADPAPGAAGGPPPAPPPGPADAGPVADSAPGSDEGAASRPDSGEFARQFAAAAEKSGLGALAREEKLNARDLLTAVGGVRGIL